MWYLIADFQTLPGVFVMNLKHINAHCDITKHDDLRQTSLDHSLVMAGRHLKLAQEYVGIAKVTVSSPLRRLISKLFGDEEPLPNETNCRVE